MRIEWLNKKGSGRVIVFFHGWGMDAAGVSHLQMEDDVLMCYDYRSLDFDFPDLGHYRCIYVVAWSMGVWAADRVISRLEMKPERCVALNGTTRPVDDEYGIPVKIYELTEKGMNERGREKFFLRMPDGADECRKFSGQKPNRGIEEVCEELCRIRELCSGVKGKLNWDKSYISEKDSVFPAQNQLNWCRKEGIPAVSLPGGHYPFYRFRSWREILGK